MSFNSTLEKKSFTIRCSISLSYFFTVGILVSCVFLSLGLSHAQAEETTDNGLHPAPIKKITKSKKTNRSSKEKASKLGIPVIKPEEKTIIEKFAAAGNFTHYRIDCKIYDLDGALVRRIPGWYCIFLENGVSLVSDGNTLEKYDKNFKKLWTQPIPVNHQIAISELNDHILTISNEYETRGNKTLRTDKVLILSDEGKILKSFSFKDYARSHPGNPMILNDWTEDKFHGKSYEETHINSFKEIIKTENNKKILVGYVAYCLKDQRIYFLDPELKSITRVLSSGGRSLHELHQISESELIYYQNQVDSEPHKLSSVGIFNLKTETFSTLYENKDPHLFSFACSSVQELPGNKLFIFHSSCRDRWTPHSGALEFVDLNTHERVLRLLPYPQGYAQHAFLINAKNYLKNNSGM